MRYYPLLAVFLLFSQCYSCRGIILPTGAETVFVPNFENNVRTAHPPTLPIEATEALKQKLQNQARLRIVQSDPDLEFRGTVVDYRITSEAPRPGEFTLLNVLTINTAVEYINHRDPDAEGWTANFSWQEPFPGDTPISAIEAQAIENILDQITEQIINKAFTEDW